MNTSEPTSMDFEIDKTVGNEGEYGVKFNEPTTEIVEEITNQSTTNDIIVVLKMIVQYLESFTMDKMSRDVMSAAADRLESQEEEKKISRYLIEMQSNVITELTARAESAEKERDAAIADLQKFRGRKCDGCFYAMKENKSALSPCRDCQSPISNYGDGWKWRGQPQEGDAE